MESLIHCKRIAYLEETKERRNGDKLIYLLLSVEKEIRCKKDIFENFSCNLQIDFGMILKL